MTRRRLTRKQTADWFLAQGGICEICGGKVTPGEAWDRDHRVALAAGGSDEPDNWRLVHRKCHRRKTADDMGVIAKTERMRQKHLGVKTRAASRLSRLKRTKDGRVIERETGKQVWP